MRYATFKYGKDWLITRVQKIRDDYLFEVVAKEDYKKYALKKAYDLNMALPNKGIIK